MMLPVSEEHGLLVEEEAQAPAAAAGRWSRWRLSVTVLGAVAATAAVAAFWALPENAVAGSVGESQSLFGFGGSTFAASASCYTYTGGNCNLHTCDVSRGATCENGKCLCEAACAGADGKCHQGETNMLVATDFTLTNVFWPKYSMYFQGASAMGQLKTTNSYSWLNLEKDKFTLYRMPGPSNMTRFMLGSVAYPSYVARIGLTVGTAISGHGFYATELSEGKGPDVLASSVCYDSAKNAIMLGNKAGTYWAYVHRGSWLVFGSSADRCAVGDGGFWKPTPDFTSEQISMLPSCCP
jgi:hypothetical protein